MKILINKDMIKSKLYGIVKETMNEKIDCVIIIMDGAFMFAADLLREFHNYTGFNPELFTMKIKTYIGDKSGISKPDIQFNILANLKNKTVLVIEDIVDTGNTINIIDNYLNKFYPKNIIYACLVSKFREIPNLNPDITSKIISLFTIENICKDLKKMPFIVGYGMDFNGKYRQLPFIVDISDVENK